MTYLFGGIVVRDSLEMDLDKDPESGVALLLHDVRGFSQDCKIVTECLDQDFNLQAYRSDHLKHLFKMKKYSTKYDYIRAYIFTVNMDIVRN